MNTPRHPFALVFVLFCCASTRVTLRAQAASDPVYEIGAIPDQRIWYNVAGHELAFVVSAPTLGANPTITMTPDQNNLPAGPLTFDAATRTCRYVPAKMDETPFTVAFVAVGSGTPLLQQITITPLPPVPPDSDAFGTGTSVPLPDDEARDYLTIDDKLTGEMIGFNDKEVGVATRSVRVIGKTVVFEAGHPNGLYEDYHGVSDVAEFSVHADTIIVRDALHLPQTSVSLHAVNLIFEDKAGVAPASISTKPLARFGGVRPTNVATKTKALPGRTAGALNLFIGDLDAPGATVRFIAEGGAGQPAMEGNAGAPLGTRTAIARTFEGHDQGTNYVLFAWAAVDTFADRYSPSQSAYEASVAWDGNDLLRDNSGNYVPNPGIAGGRPGDGGAGGAITSTLDLSSRGNVGGGLAGAKAATAAGGRGVRVQPNGGGALSSVGYRRKYLVSHNVLTGEDTFYGTSTQTFTGPDGAAAPAPNPDVPVGAAGSTTQLSSDLRWLDPAAMRVVLAYLNDAYLDGHFDAVRTDLESYILTIDLARQMPGWTDLTGDVQADLEQIRDELQSMQHRVGNNLDYFGNPAGWVPMLSFEVNKLAFDNEINRALRVMYLNYWLGHRAQSLQQQLDAMRAMRVQLLAQIDQDRADYSDAVSSIPLVEADAAELQADIDGMLFRVRQIEDELLPKAKSIVVLKKTARTLGKIAQTIPVYQPALGLVGGAVAASADIDPNKSWEENGILVGTGAAQGFVAGKAAGKAANAKQSIDGINTSDPEANDAETQAALRQAREPLMQLMRDSYSAVSASKASDPEVAAELQRLLADVPEYRVLQKGMEKLGVRKRDFFNRLADLHQRITVTTIAIARNLRTVDLLNRQIAAQNQKLDPNLLGYLHDMDRRARARLLKYHYYVSRAYAYRRLEAYPGSLNLQTIFDKFVELANNGATEELNAAQFDSLKAVYEEQISSVAEAILGDLNNSPPEQSQSIDVPLPADVIAQINAGETGRFNLKDTGLFTVSEENFRITDIQVSAMSVTFDASAPAPAYADLVVKHSGLSELKRDGRSFLFRHYSDQTRNAITWKARRQFSNGNIVHSKPSAASASLIAALVPGTQNLLLYSRPAAFADLLFSLESNNQDAVVQLQSVTLQVSYDYTDKADAIKSLRVIGAANGVEPDITLSVDDRNGRGSGRGELERYYDLNTSVIVSVPASVGDFAFDHWTGGGITNPTQASQTLVMNRHYQLTPVYRSTVNYTVQVNGAAGGGTYAVGDVVSLVATPPPGATFLRWEGEGVQDPNAPETVLYVFENSSVSAIYSSIGSFRSAFINISNRAQVGTGADILIPGFFLSGTTPKNILVRVVGPTLGADPFNVPGVLADTTLKIFSGSTLVAENDDWGTNTNLADLVAATNKTFAFPLNAGSKDAAVLISLPPGGYTVHAAGANGTTGVALVELYDAEPENTASKFINVSGRALVGAGADVLIPGFSIDGNEPKTVLVRAVGPTLGAAPFNVPGVLVDPQLTVYQGQTALASNDNWGDASNAAQIRSTTTAVQAFALQEGGRDAVALLTLPPGSYTAVVSGISGATGVALVEVYEVP